jgi:hypothetical protein
MRQREYDCGELIEPDSQARPIRMVITDDRRTAAQYLQMLRKQIQGSPIPIRKSFWSSLGIPQSLIACYKISIFNWQFSIIPFQF